MYGNNGYGNNNYGQPQYGQPQQNQEERWPGVSGFSIGPSKTGKTTVITFTVNAGSKSQKNPKLTFDEFMHQMQQAFQESGGNGARIVISFAPQKGPRGMFMGANIKVSANTPPAHAQGSFGGGAGRGRGSYQPPQAQGGYGQPPYPQNGGQQGWQPPTQGYAPQGTPQFGAPLPGAPTQGYPQGGPGQPAPQTAYPSNPPVQQPAAAPAPAPVAPPAQELPGKPAF